MPIPTPPRLPARNAPVTATDTPSPSRAVCVAGPLLKRPQFRMHAVECTNPSPADAPPNRAFESTVARPSNSATWATLDDQLVETASPRTLQSWWPRCHSTAPDTAAFPFALADFPTPAPTSTHNPSALFVGGLVCARALVATNNRKIDRANRRIIAFMIWVVRNNSAGGEYATGARACD